MEIPLAEVAERVAGKISTGLVIAAAIVGVAIYSRPSPPRYQAVVEGGRIVRIDTTTGSVIACEAGRCMLVLRRGQRLERGPRPALLPKQGAQPEQAAPSGRLPEAPPTEPAPQSVPR